MLYYKSFRFSPYFLTWNYRFVDEKSDIVTGFPVKEKKAIKSLTNNGDIAECLILLKKEKRIRQNYCLFFLKKIIPAITATMTIITIAESAMKFITCVVFGSAGIVDVGVSVGLIVGVGVVDG